MDQKPDGAITPTGTYNQWLSQQLAGYPLVDALHGRRSRRFGVGMKIEQGPFAYESKVSPEPLTEDEEAALAFAASGITGYALADLDYGTKQGGDMLGGLIGRTIGSADAVNTVSVVVINDEATYLLKRPQDFAYNEIPELIQLGKQGKLVDLYHRMRIKIRDGRTTIPVEPGLNFNINKWSLYAKGGTYFLPINEMTAVYINGLLEIFDPAMGLYILDERNLFRPAGLSRFAKSKGGFLHDSSERRMVTIQGIELSFAEASAVEQGMALQNLGLMAQLLGLGGFPNYARNEYRWLEALGFRLESMPSSRYAGAPGIFTALLQLLGRDKPFPYAVSLEVDNQTVLGAYCPPNYPSMADAVRAYVQHKFGSAGVFREGAYTSDWKTPGADEIHIRPPSEEAIEATIAYCEYIYNRYGRFPAYSAPFRTVIGYQATHVDVDFYKRFFRPEALTNTQREHSAWHGQEGQPTQQGSQASSADNPTKSAATD